LLIVDFRRVLLREEDGCSGLIGVGDVAVEERDGIVTRFFFEVCFAV